MDAEIVYPPYGNAIDVVLTENGKALEELGPITRCVLTLGATVLDSDLNPGVFTWPVAGIREDVAVEALRISLGAEGLAPGLYQGQLVSYDSAHPAGLLWTKSLPIVVEAVT